MSRLWMYVVAAFVGIGGLVVFAHAAIRSRYGESLKHMFADAELLRFAVLGFGLMVIAVALWLVLRHGRS